MTSWKLSENLQLLRYEQVDGPYAVEPRGEDWVVTRIGDRARKSVSGPFASSDDARGEADRLRQTGP